MATSGPVGRPRRSRQYIVIGTVLAVVAFLAAAGLASAPYLFPASSLGTKVVVAKSNIPARTLDRCQPGPARVLHQHVGGRRQGRAGRHPGR